MPPQNLQKEPALARPWFQASHIQKCEGTNLCCLQPPNSGSFVLATLGNEYCPPIIQEQLPYSFFIHISQQASRTVICGLTLFKISVVPFHSLACPEFCRRREVLLISHPSDIHHSWECVAHAGATGAFRCRCTLYTNILALSCMWYRRERKMWYRHERKMSPVLVLALPVSYVNIWL